MFKDNQAVVTTVKWYRSTSDLQSWRRTVLPTHLSTTA